MPRKNLTFEESLTQLEALVVQLEKGELSLEESLKAYEQGVALAASCEKALETARLKLSELGDEPEEQPQS